MEYIGDIHLGETVMISDPSYRLDTWCQIPINPKVTDNDMKMKPGRYSCYVKKVDAGDWGERIAELLVFYHNKPEYINDSIPWEGLIGEVGVDGGLAGVYDYDYFTKYHSKKDVNEEWYNQFVYNSNRNVFINDNMFVTSSGFGDGGYDASVKLIDDNTVVAIKVTFLWEDDDEEDEEED